MPTVETCDKQSPESRFRWLANRMPPWLQEQLHQDPAIRELTKRTACQEGFTFPDFMSKLCEMLFEQRNKYRDTLREYLAHSPAPFLISEKL